MDLGELMAKGWEGGCPWSVLGKVWNSLEQVLSCVSPCPGLVPSPSDSSCHTALMTQWLAHTPMSPGERPVLPTSGHLYRHLC